MKRFSGVSVFFVGAFAMFSTPALGSTASGGGSHLRVWSAQLKRFTLACLFIIGALAACAIAALAQQAQIVHIYVFVTGQNTSEHLDRITVHYDEPPTACNGMHGGHVTGRTSEGEAALAFIGCTGPATLTIEGGAEFDTQTKQIQIEPGQRDYDVSVRLEPKGRLVHIRVQGRLANGSLVPVHFATVYDGSDRHVATTDYNGIGTASIKEVIGETVTLRADATHWRPASATYTAGAYHSGSKLTRSEDYVNFVLNSEEEPAKQQIAMQIMVKGTKDGKQMPLEDALIYDQNGVYLTSTDSRGHAAALIEEAFGETFRVTAKKPHWNSQTLSLLARSETRSGWYAGPPGSKYLYQQVRFTLSPATNEIGDLVVEVVDRNTDKPVPAAAVWLYKPNGFPGTLVGSETTNHNGEATFDNRHVERALSGTEARVAVKHGGYEEAIQTVAGSLTTTELPRYVVYLKPKTENTKWSGTWVQGPYTIQISGGTGSLGYNALRSEGVGGCCPLVDQSGANCQVIGNKAICQYHGHYHDSAKDVTYSGHGTLTLSGDYIQYNLTETQGQITLSSGQPCPDITQCTGLHPGANFVGTWTRKKP